jgi:O-antigen/teichoic acid export membrane protein
VSARPRDTTARSLLRGSVARTIELGSSVVSALAVTPILVLGLGDRAFGFWSLAVAIVGYLSLLDLGLSAAVTRFVSRASAREDAGELERAAGTALGLFLGAAGAIAAALALGVALTPRFVPDPAEALMFQKTLAVMGAAAVLALPAKVHAGLLMADVKYDSVAGIAILKAAIFAGGIWLCVHEGLGLAAAAAVSAAATVFQAAALYAACRRRFPDLRIRLAAFDPASARELLAYGLKSLLCQIGELLSLRLDAVVIGSFLSVGLIAQYSIGVRIVETLCRLVFGAFGMMAPVFSRYEGRGDDAAIRRGLLVVTKLCAILSTLACVSAIFYAEPFVTRWLGTRFVPAARVAAILCLASTISLPHSPGIQLLYGVSKHKAYAALSMGEGVLNLGLSIFLLRRYGIYGVALGTLLAAALVRLTLQPLYVARIAGLSLKAYLFDSMLAVQLKTAAALVVFFRLAAPLLAPDYAALGAALALELVIFLPAAYLFLLAPEERRLVIGALRPPRALEAAS